MSTNLVFLTGYAGADPEKKFWPSGDFYVRIRLGTTERWTDKDSGDKRSKTEWHNVIVTGSDSYIDNYVMQAKKGAHLKVIGSNRTRKFIDANKVERYVTDVVSRGEVEILDRKPEKPESPPADDSVGHPDVPF